MQYEIPLGTAKKIRNKLFHQVNDYVDIKRDDGGFIDKNVVLKTPEYINSCNNGLFTNEERQALVRFNGIHQPQNNVQNRQFL